MIDSTSKDQVVSQGESPSFQRIKDYYRHFDEWSRLDSAAGYLEKEMIVNLVASTVQAPGHMLDLGSGPGRYAKEFLQLGHRVTLVDISQSLIDTAKDKLSDFYRKDLLEVYVGNAINLHDFPSSTFDSVFCNGPFYHLIHEEDRLKAGQEIFRTCKIGGTIFIGFIPYFSALSGIIHRAAKAPSQVDAACFEQVVSKGVFRNCSSSGFQEGYFPRVEDFTSFWRDLGMKEIQLYSTRSFMHQREEDVLEIKQSDPDLFKEIMRTSIHLATQSVSIAAGGHALIVGKK